MNKISCDMCLDLIPLVNDQVASEASKKAVLGHIKECESCREFYEIEDVEEWKMNDNRVIMKIRKQLYVAAIIAIVFGTILGTVLTDSMGLFYNILIMPAIGVIGYFVVPKEPYYVPAGLFVFIYIWLFIKYIVEGTALSGALIMPLFWAFIYAGLCYIGVIIVFLLKIAFGKGEK